MGHGVWLYVLIAIFSFLSSAKGLHYSHIHPYSDRNVLQMTETLSDSQDKHQNNHATTGIKEEIAELKTKIDALEKEIKATQDKDERKRLGKREEQLNDRLIELMRQLTAADQKTASDSSKAAAEVEIKKMEMQKQFGHKRGRSDLPGPTSGSKWNHYILEQYNIHITPEKDMERFLGFKPPALSDRGKQVMEECKEINRASVMEAKFPDNTIGNHIAKLLYLTLFTDNNQYECVVDDMMAALLHHMGFNDGSLVVLTKSQLSFIMSNSDQTEATADVTIVDVTTWYRLAVWEDKSWKVSNQVMSIPDVHEPQLVAEAIAAAQYNLRLFTRRKRANSVPSASSSASDSKKADSNDYDDDNDYNRFDPNFKIDMMLIRVLGEEVTFYRAPLTGQLLNSVAYKEPNPPKTTIYKYTSNLPEGPSRFYPAKLRLSLPEEREIIITILDALCQTFHSNPTPTLAML